ncbi:MAG TPA: 5-formyltetrahydrofolate cyclo-ligase [bacterium]|nr:5-formyltetrahydrofolate cyclo-ligase [bacterium]HOL47051.1 5-formyltetrahydrofolate cyclo-ligase [bacterium]HPQ17944.1 5-formyltetrahydrofolate cyclo-ligase [bacterium]
MNDFANLTELSKVHLRKKFLAIRQNYDKNLLSDYNHKIKINVLDFIKKNNLKSIFIYVSKENEVDTFELIKILLNENYKITVPKINIEKKIILPVQLFDINLLKIGRYKIYEPLNNDINIDFEIIFVPGIVFDNNFNRIGYGAGYFDKFLKEHITKLKIGLAYSFQIINKIINEPNDVQLDGYITENEMRIKDGKRF